jgi:hypothetical protein
VLMVPRVPISEGGAVADTGDLVSVVPPRHDAGIVRGVLLEPDVRLKEKNLCERGVK